MLRCQGFEVKNYDFTLGRLVYESLRRLKDPGNNLGMGEINDRETSIKCVP